MLLLLLFGSGDDRGGGGGISPNKDDVFTKPLNRALNTKMSNLIKRGFRFRFLTAVHIL